jgi:hypothetical protein
MFARYAEISKFRRPYAEAYFHGFGAGEVAPLVGVQDARGWYVVSSTDKAAVETDLAALPIIGGMEAVTGVPGVATPGATPFDQWRRDHLRAGSVILVQRAGTGYVLVAMQKDDVSGIALKSQAAPVLAEPDIFDRVGITKTQALVGAGVGLAIAVGVYAYTHRR